MRTTQTIDERLDYAAGVYSQDISSADVTGEWVDMSGYNRVAALVTSGQLASADAVEVTLQQATDANGSDAKDLGSTVTYTAGSADEVAALLAEAAASDLDIANDFRYVAAKVGATPDGSTTINGSAVMIRADGDYRP